jgi:hypothetical protein
LNAPLGGHVLHLVGKAAHVFERAAGRFRREEKLLSGHGLSRADELTLDGAKLAIQHRRNGLGLLCAGRHGGNQKQQNSVFHLHLHSPRIAPMITNATVM